MYKRMLNRLAFSVYLLFAFFLLGSLVGICVSSHSSLMLSAPTFPIESVWVGLRSCLLYHGLIIVCAPFAVGFAVVPLVLFMRGWVLTSTVAVMCMSQGISNREIWLECAFPALLQIQSLLYVGAVVFRARLNRTVSSGRVVPNEISAQTVRGLLVSLVSLLCAAVMEIT